MSNRLLVGGDLVLYGDVGLSMFGDGFTALDVIGALAEHGNGPLDVRINSGGGQVFEGVAIYNTLIAHPGTLTVYVDGIAASAASVIALAGKREGHKLVIRPGAQMMIHRPMADTFGGTAEDHEANAALLTQLEETVAQIYATHTGGSVKEIRELMDAETWLTAEDAVELGFATEVGTITDGVPEKDRKMADDNTEVQDEAVMEASSGVVMEADAGEADMAADAAVSMETDEDEKEDDEEETMTAARKKGGKSMKARLEASRAVRAQAAAMSIFNRCAVAKLSMSQTNLVLQKAGGNVEKAKDLIINMIAARDPAPKGGVMPAPATVVADARDKFVTGATLAVLARAGFKEGERNEYAGMTMKELAQESLMHLGVRKKFKDPMAMVAAAFRPQVVLGNNFMPRMDSVGYHSTSDFADITSNVAHKSMLKGFEESEETFERWTARGTLTDFKTHSRVDMNLFPSLAAVPQNAEYKYVTTGDRAQTWTLATYGNIFAISRQSIINDDLSVFTRIPSRMGRAARRTVGDLVYALLTDNPTMPDSVALFHADHDNLVEGTPGGAPSVDTIKAAHTAMATQRDPDNNAAALGIRPKYLICPIALEMTAKMLAASQYQPGETFVPNPIAGTFEVISDARLDIHNAAGWYMAADPNTVDTIEVGYLNGVSQPTMEQRDGFNVDGVEFKVRLDAAAQVFDHRGLYSNEG
jgi:ATP-dependent protease ClpP protease subunit